VSKKFYTASFDYVFKRIFGDKRNIHILKAFLIAALGLKGLPLKIYRKVE
jgi:hypothetical protein